MNAKALRTIERSLELILAQSTLNVRILTRSPLAKKYFPLMKQFGNRLMFGMSLPTTNDRLNRSLRTKGPVADNPAQMPSRGAGFRVERLRSDGPDISRVR